MSIATEKTHVTLEELLASEDAGRFELVDGQLEEVFSTNLTAKVNVDLLTLLKLHCKTHGLGQVLASGAYYRCFGDDGLGARKPDVSFISRERLPPNWLDDAYFTIPPDLAVEVISTHDLASSVRRKTEEYLRAGVNTVWEIDPESRTVLIHRQDGTTQRLHGDGTLSGESVLPGFTCKLAEFFPIRG